MFYMLLSFYNERHGLFFYISLRSLLRCGWQRAWLHTVVGIFVAMQQWLEPCLFSLRCDVYLVCACSVQYVWATFNSGSFNSFEPPHC